MFDVERCDDFQEHRCSACIPDSSRLPFLSQPFYPTADLRRQHTRDLLTKQSYTGGTSTRFPRCHTSVVLDSLEVVGKKLHVGSEELSLSRTCCGRLAAFDDELHISPCVDHCDSAAEYHHSSPIHISLLATSTDHCNNCCKSRSCRPDIREADEKLVDDYHSVRQSCPTCQQEAPLPNERDKTTECSEIDVPDPERLLQTSPGTYRNARVDQNRLLKLLRKFDTIRQRACAARETCRLRFEMRQKQRLRLLDWVDSNQQQKDAGEEVLDIPTGEPSSLENDGRATATATWNDLGKTVDVKLRDVIDLCDPARSNNFVTTWPPLLSDETTSIEPTDAVISTLMSRFEQIRLDGVTARLQNQKRFENKRKQRKYKI